jgi:hypothetical protein
MLVLCLVVLAVFALYAPSVQLMLLHDDAINIAWMQGYSPISIFAADWTAGGASARPMANALWLLTRDLFGWFIPPVIHTWNVWLHALNTVLVAMLALRLGQRLGLPGLIFPALAGLFFGFTPLLYQSVIWAGAIYHPVMAAFGLLAIHASLFARERQRWGMWVLCFALVVAAALSHEAGFIFGLLVLLTQVALSVARRERLPKPAIAIAALSLMYPLINRVIVGASGSNAASRLRPLDEIITNAVYFMQGMVSWLVILLRPPIGLTESAPLIIVGLFVIAAGLSLVFLARVKALWLGLFALSWWAIFSLAQALVLDKAYVSFGPRLLYVPAIGIALFWAAVVAAVVAALVRAIRQPALKMAPLGFAALLLAWCVPYVNERIAETARLTPAMTAIDADLRALDPNGKVLLINLPWWNAPTYPAFFVGAEGMPLFQHDGAPAWTWLATVSGTRRETATVKHEASLTRDARWNYGQPGETLDDAALRQRMLASDLIYAFDYDPPGVRTIRIGQIERSDALPSGFVAKLSDGDAHTFLRGASATQCDGVITLDLSWSASQPLGEPVGVFVHGLNAQGEQTITADRDLLSGVLPLDQVPAGVTIYERRVIPAPADTGEVTELRVGAYRRADVSRLTATRADGETWPGDEVVVPVQAVCM